MELYDIIHTSRFLCEQERHFYSQPSSVYIEANEGMGSPAVYIPTDRRQAMARGESLLDQMYGAALFADLSGFAPPTEALIEESHD